MRLSPSFYRGLVFKYEFKRGSLLILDLVFVHHYFETERILQIPLAYYAQMLWVEGELTISPPFKWQTGKK